MEFIKKYGKLNITKDGSKSIFIETKVHNLIIEFTNNSILELHSGYNNKINELFYIGKYDPPKYNSAEIRFTNYPSNIIKHFFTMHYNSMWIAWSIETEGKDMEHRIFLRKYDKIKKIAGIFQIEDKDINIFDNLKEGDKLVEYLEEILELDSRVTEDGHYIPTSEDIKKELKNIENKINNVIKNERN